MTGGGREGEGGWGESVAETSTTKPKEPDLVVGGLSSRGTMKHCGETVTPGGAGEDSPESGALVQCRRRPILLIGQKA